MKTSNKIKIELKQSQVEVRTQNQNKIKKKNTNSGLSTRVTPCSDLVPTDQFQIYDNKKGIKKTCSIKWPGLLFGLKTSILIEGTFHCNQGNFWLNIMKR